MNVQVPPEVRSKPLNMLADEFLAWREEQSEGRFELVDGEVFQMAAETAIHGRVKFRVAVALERALVAAGIDCEVFGDGMALRVAGGAVYEPDVSVLIGPRIADESVLLGDPLLVVEVISPSSRQVDTGAKLDGYFSLPSLRHYLIVHPVTRVVIHHRRVGAERIETRILHAPRGVESASPDLVLDPPGVSLPVLHLFDAP